jgi:hypothetical protein
MALVEPEKSPLNRLLEYEIGYAASGYSTCRTCGNRIELKGLRLGVTWQLVDDQTGQPYPTTTTYWYHLSIYDTIRNGDRFCFEEWACEKRRTDVKFATTYLRHLGREDQRAVSDMLERIQDTLKLTTPAPSLSIPQTQGSCLVGPDSPAGPMPARVKDGVTLASFTPLHISHTLENRWTESRSRECLIVLGDRTGIEKDVLEDLSLAMALYLQQHGLIDKQGWLTVTHVVKELLVHNVIRLEVALLDFRVVDPASMYELIDLLWTKTDYKTCDVFFCGHGFDDGCFAVRNGGRVSGSELASSVRDRREVALYFNCCYAERLVLSACAWFDKQTGTECTQTIITTENGIPQQKVTTITETYSTSFDQVKLMILKQLELEIMDPTVADSHAAIGLLGRDSFDQHPTQLARSNVVRSNKPMTLKNNIIVDTSDIKEIAAEDSPTPPRFPRGSGPMTPSETKHTGRVTHVLATTKILIDFNFQLPTGLVLRPLGLGRIAPAGGLPTAIAHGYNGYIDWPKRDGWKNWASSIMDELKSVDAVTREAVENTFRSTWPIPLKLPNEQSAHVDDEAPVVTAFNVGQGDSYLISMPAGKDGEGDTTHGFMLVDTGNYGAQTVWWPLVSAFTPLRMLALTHCDADHVGGAKAFIEQCREDPVKLTAKSYFWGDEVTYMRQRPHRIDRNLQQVATFQSALQGQCPVRGTILNVGTYCSVYVLSPTKAVAEQANRPECNITRATVAGLVLLVVWRGATAGSMRKMLFAGDAPWSCVRDGIAYFQTTTIPGADGATQKAIKEVFGTKGDKVDVDFMTVPHHGSTSSMDIKWNYPIRATNIIVCSGDGGIKYPDTMADGTAVTDLLEQFGTATAYCTMAKFRRLKNKCDAKRIEYLAAGESCWALKVG